MSETASPINQQDIEQAIEALGLAGAAVCLHASLSSFGKLDGGPDAVINAFLNEGCTLLVPTFTESFEVAPDDDQLIERNGWDVIEAQSLPRRTETVFSPELNLIDADMGAIPKAVLERPERLRGDHPLNSFSAIGPRAKDLIEEQAWNDVYAPLRELTKLSGFIVLAGTGLNRMTILHLAETLAGRRLFRRWVTGPTGETVMVPIGGCSEGFPNLESIIGMLAIEQMVGASQWRVFSSPELVTIAASHIRVEPHITACGNPECTRCPAAIAGGPRL